MHNLHCNLQFASSRLQLAAAEILTALHIELQFEGTHCEAEAMLNDIFNTVNVPNAYPRLTGLNFNH
jgi:hypothetical protein